MDWDGIYTVTAFIAMCAVFMLVVLAFRLQSTTLLWLAVGGLLTFYATIRA